MKIACAECLKKGFFRANQRRQGGFFCKKFRRKASGGGRRASTSFSGEEENESGTQELRKARRAGEVGGSRPPGAIFFLVFPHFFSFPNSIWERQCLGNSIARFVERSFLTGFTGLNQNPVHANNSVENFKLLHAPPLPAIELRAQVRSQMEFGNEGNERQTSIAANESKTHSLFRGIRFCLRLLALFSRLHGVYLFQLPTRH